MKSPAILFLCLLLFSFPARAEDFQSWLAGLEREALAQGIAQHTLDAAFANVSPIPRVVELDRKQPENHLTFEQYKKNVLPSSRVEKGRALYRQNRALIDRIAARYGVQGPYLVALWGMETSYGANTGGFDIIPALATLAYDGRRSDFFRQELLTALKIAQAGHIDFADMRGSWAGAMGQNQFMPSSFEKFAADGDGDGRKDIWKSLPDVMASSANYLSRQGWKGNERWGRAVDVPESLLQAPPEGSQTLSYWAQRGVTLLDGTKLPREGMKAHLVLPDGVGGQAFLVYDNFQVIKTWNKSTYFATSVGLLADAIAQ